MKNPAPWGTPGFIIHPLPRKDRIVGASFRARAAISAGIRVDDVFVRAFADGAVRAFALAGAATDAVIGNSVSHVKSSLVGWAPRRDVFRQPLLLKLCGAGDRYGHIGIISNFFFGVSRRKENSKNLYRDSSN